MGEQEEVLRSSCCLSIAVEGAFVLHISMSGRQRVSSIRLRRRSWETAAVMVMTNVEITPSNSLACNRSSVLAYGEVGRPCELIHSLSSSTTFVYVLHWL